MASTHQSNPVIGNAYRSGRGFAAVDPERLREVEFSVRPSGKGATTPRQRPASTEWFNPPRANSPVLGTSRGR
jgi:hypothetical protein